MFALLAHDRRAHHHAQRIEADFCLIEVGIGDEPGLEDAVVVVGFDFVADGIAGGDEQ